MTLTRSALISAFLAVILMSSVPVIIKIINASEVQIGLVRLCIGVIGLYVFLRFRKYRWQLSKTQWLALIILGITFGLHWFTYFKSIKLSSPSIAAIGVGTFGIHLVILSHFFLKQRIKRLDWLAMVLALFGLYLVTPNFSWQSDYFQGLMYAVVSGLLYACLPVIHQKSAKIPNNVRSWGQFCFALIPFILLDFPDDWRLSNFDWMGLAYLGVVATLIAHSLWVKATTELPGTVTGMIYYLYIPVAMVLSFLFFGEKFTVSKVAGAAIIIAANMITLYIRWKGSSKSKV